MSVLPVQNPIDNPGQARDNIYQTSDNMMVSSARVMSDTCYEQAFNNTRMGASGISFVIPADKLLSNVMVRFVFGAGKINSTNGGDPKPTNQVPFLHAGWAYSMIRRIRYQFQNSQTLEIGSRQNMIEALRNCGNEHKRQRLLELAGPQLLNGNPDNDVAGIAHITLPFSNMLGDKHKIPFDSSIMNGPCTVWLDIACREDVFSGCEGNAQYYPAAFTSGTFHIQQYTLVDLDDSVKELVSRRGTDKYIYSYMYPQAYVSDREFVGKPGTDCASDKNVETLRGFQAGSVLGLVLYLERVQPSTDAQNKIAYDDILNLEVKFGGQCVYKASSNADRYWCLTQQEDGCDYPVSVPAPGNQVAPYSTPGAPIGFSSPYTEVWFSQYCVKAIQDLLQTGADLSNNVLTVSFNTPDDSTYRLHASYLYQAGVRVAKGSTSLIFQSAP